MKILFRLAALSLLPIGAFAQSIATTADRVLGQVSFLADATSGATPTSLAFPLGMAISPVSGKLFISDSGANRILRFGPATSLGNTAVAEAVFGQPNLNSGTANNGGLGAKTLSSPSGIWIDDADRLWVADSSNNRVLRFDNASTAGDFATAVRVFGQPDFLTASAAVTAAKMSRPTNVTIDTLGNLWVADAGNGRVLRFANAATRGSGVNASGVLGQPGFVTSNSAVSLTTISSVDGIALDSAGTLWVADSVNNRILRYTDAAFRTGPTGVSADSVLGQFDGFSSTAVVGSTTILNSPRGLFLDPLGRLWVSDGNARVLRYDQVAKKTIGGRADGVLGQPDFESANNTTPPNARSLGSASGGFAMDVDGNLWIVDSDNNRAVRFPAIRAALPDLTPPTLTLTGKVPKTTSRSTQKLSGRALDASEIAKVEFRIGNGKFLKANGTTNWNFTARLAPGKNKIQIRAVDGSGNVSAPRTITIRLK